MGGRTWKNQSSETLQKIKSDLLELGGAEVDIKNSSEVWRIKIDDSVFISFKNGTLYHTPSNSDSAEVAAASERIDSITGTGYLPTDKDIMIGLDETGKGEIAGPVVLAGVIFPSTLFNEIVSSIGPADTKKQHGFEYWDELFSKLTKYRQQSFYFITEKISPLLFDKYNVNNLLDLFYRKIIFRLLKSASGKSCRIVLDDYGANKLKNSGFFGNDPRNELIIIPQAEDQYIEAKAASLIAKRFRETNIHHINRLPEYRIDGLSVGPGNVGNINTKQWLQKWHSSGKPWPWFIKKSFKTIREFDGKSDKEKKEIPTLKTELLPQEFVGSFRQAAFTQNLASIKCENCNQFQPNVYYDFYKIVCPTCSKPIDDLQLTLRYYCGSVLIDNAILEHRILIKDLETNAFFENYRAIILWKESDKKNNDFVEGIKELKRFEQLGRLDIGYFQLNSNVQRDVNSILVDKATETRSIILTSNKELIDLAKQENIFTVIVRSV